MNTYGFGIVIAAHSLSASDGTSAVSAAEALEPEPELEVDSDSDSEIDPRPKSEWYLLEEEEEGEGEEEEEGTSYSFLRISVGTEPFVMQPSPSHHLRKALQCLSLRRVEESPITTKPDLARVTK